MLIIRYQTLEIQLTSCCMIVARFKNATVTSLTDHFPALYASNSPATFCSVICSSSVDSFPDSYGTLRTFLWAAEGSKFESRSHCLGTDSSRISMHFWASRLQGPVELMVKQDLAILGRVGLRNDVFESSRLRMMQGWPLRVD